MSSRIDPRGRAPFALATLLSIVLALIALPSAAHEPPPPPEPPPACSEDCFLLSSLTLRGNVETSMTFELRGGIRSRDKDPTKVPLFGPPNQVRLDNVTIDGAPAQIGFESDSYYLYTSARSFVVRGRITLGDDQLLTVPGPIVSLDAHLTKGKLVEGDRLSGIVAANLHFDPMNEAEDGEAKQPRVATVFRLSRAIRFGKETTFVYRLQASQGTDIVSLRLPLRYGEKIGDVQGAAGHSVEGSELVLPVSGKEAEIVISGTLSDQPADKGPRAFTPDSRCSYEWWLIEGDPEHRIATAGEPKLVETSQSPIPPTMPGARVFLVQRGQQLEVDARSLVRGDALAAVARTHKRFVAITGSGELISDETIGYDNHGLDHVLVTPAGKTIYLSTDGNAQKILHREAGSKEVLVPALVGGHALRIQSLSSTRVWPVAGVISIPAAAHPLATSTAETTVGLPEHVRPIAVLGGDRIRWAFARADLVAIAIGIALACFGLRTHKTRALGAVVTAGLWFVSHEGFVLATGVLFVSGGIFVASRFLRSSKLVLASGAVLVIAILGGKAALDVTMTHSSPTEMTLDDPTLPQPESSGASSSRMGDPTADITPVSISFPTSERYVVATRQLVTPERPFVPRVVYVTSGTIAFFHIVWLALFALLGWAHRDRLVLLKQRLFDRLMKRPDPAAEPEAPPF